LTKSWPDSEIERIFGPDVLHELKTQPLLQNIQEPSKSIVEDEFPVPQNKPELSPEKQT
jgi:hypothetical protein